MKELPVVGAAFRIERLSELKSWILDTDRDVEIQNPTYNFPVGDWKERASFWNTEMSSFRGRLGVHGPYDGVALASRDPDAQAYTQRKLLDCLDFCESISATHCVIHSPFQFLGSGVACHTEAWALDYLIDNFRTTMTPVIERAEQIGCYLVLENIFDRNTAPLRALLRAVNSPMLRRSVDTGHARICEKTASGPSPEFCILEANTELEHIHLQDTNGENDYHWTPGVGDLNWNGIFQAIHSIDAKPRLIIEVKDIMGAWDFFTSNQLAQ